VQGGRQGRSVVEVADDLGCDWHTVMDAVNRHGAPLVGNPGRIGTTLWSAWTCVGATIDETWLVAPTSKS
jgi:hypothetical protein